jgi:ssDNA-binding Zn-finger/Zn-ribbon topoisomerase 1
MLLAGQIRRLEKDFMEHGGIRERMTAARVAKLNDEDAAEQAGNPICPECASTMVARTARKGPNKGSKFWGCSKFPSCKGVREMEEA